MNEGKNFESEYDNKLCVLSSSTDQSDIDLAERLSRDGRYVCTGCGRVSVEEEYLCSPEEL
jgi:hypothetical protein